MPSFHERLKELRNESGKTQAKIAEDLGITPQAFSYFVSGREPNYDTLIKMAQYFNVTVDYLLGLENSRNREYFQNLNQELEDLGQILTTTASRPELLNWLSWTLASGQLKMIDQESEPYSELLRNCIYKTIYSMACESKEASEIVAQDSIDLKSLVDFAASLNQAKNTALASLTGFYDILMDIVDKAAAKAASPESKQLYQNLFSILSSVCSTERIKDIVQSDPKGLESLGPIH